MALFIILGDPGMSEENGPEAGSRWTCLDGSIRLIDASHSRMALEMDLGSLPWDPFNALGKQVTVLIPTPQAWGEPPGDDDDDLGRALRFVVHAANRSKEFSQAGNGDKSDWWVAFQTWDWLRKHLTARLADRSIPLPKSEMEPERNTPAAALPNLPGAASVLGYALGALKSIPLDQWERTVSGLDPEAPSREEAIQTIIGLSRLLRTNPTKGGGSNGSHPEKEASGPSKAEGEVSKTATLQNPGDGSEQGKGEMSYDYAHGYDEGYQLGRRVGFALGSHRRPTGDPTP